MNILVIWNDGVVAVAATLESVVPPAGHKYISGIRYIGSKHVSKDPHSFLQCLLIRLSFNAFRFPIRQRHDQNIRTRVCIFHVLMTKQQISSQLGWVQWVTSYDLIIKRHYTYQSITSICHSVIKHRICVDITWMYICENVGDSEIPQCFRKRTRVIVKIFQSSPNQLRGNNFRCCGSQNWLSCTYLVCI